MKKILLLPFLFSICVAAPKRPLEFTTMIAHWANYAHKDYLPFVKEARPELAQIGFYGAHYWSLAHTEHGGGYPAHFPKVGLKENRVWFRQRNRDLHALDTLVVGHFNIEFLVGDPSSDKGPRGFFKFYRDLWDEKLLGPKPIADPLKLLERDAAGKPLTNKNYSIGGMREYWACLNNPHWRAVLKARMLNSLFSSWVLLTPNMLERSLCMIRSATPPGALRVNAAASSILPSMPSMKPPKFT